MTTRGQATNRTERVVMMWEPKLKQRVRERVGTRGLTDFVIEAVKEKLETMPPVNQAEMEALKEKRATEAMAAEPVEQSPIEHTMVTNPTRLGERAIKDVPLPGDPKPTNGLAGRYGSSRDGLQEMIAQAQAAGIDIGPASELPPVDPKVPVGITVETSEGVTQIVAGKCPTCGEPLIDDECWTCD